MTVLQERERELAALDAALEEAGAGRGGAVSIEGGAGLGKTRLLKEVRSIAVDAGFDVLTARATDLERNFPFALVRQLFESPLAALAEGEQMALLEGAEAARRALGLDRDRDERHDSFAVFHGLYWVTAALAEKGPLLLAIDDAHAADVGSLDYLGFLMPRIEELPVLVVVAARSEEPHTPAALGQVLSDAAVQNLALAPLSSEASTALLAQELGREPEQQFAAACYEVTGGNLFYLYELAIAIREQGIEPSSDQAEMVRELSPKRATRMILMRVARLPPDAGAVARSLAILGDGTDFRLLAEFAGVGLDEARRAADELRASAILDAEPTPRFSHPLVRTAIYLDMPVGERAASHRRAASLLRAHNLSPERIATQLLACEPGGDLAAVETLVEAGKRSLATGAPPSAVAYLTRALEETPPAHLRTEILGQLMTAGLRAADHSVLASIDASVRSELERDPSLYRDWANTLALFLTLCGRFEEAVSMLQDGVEAAVAAGDLELAFQLEAQLSKISLVLPSRSTVSLSHHLDEIDPDSPSGRLAAAMEVRIASVSGTADEAADAAERALANDGAIFAEEPDPMGAMGSVSALISAERFDQARYAVERAIAIARERASTPDLSLACGIRGAVALGDGDLLAAEVDVRQALDIARLAGIAALVMLGVAPMVQILIERDELEAAEAELQSLGMAEGPIPESAVVAMVRYERGHLRFARGELEQAIEDFGSLTIHPEEIGLGPSPSLLVGPFAARALISLGEHARARELVDSLMASAKRWGTPTAIANGLRADAAVRGGAEGISLLEEAVALQVGGPARVQRAHALVELGEALRREGARARARAPLREGFKLARQCGAARLAKRAHAELEATGETLRRYTPIGVESLTPSERRVAEMAASGMTNRQIAQSLFVTVKTVEAHLSAAYDKLDIESREQLPGVL
jgi:DNA-binding CsgD family transcriptional regulator/tetratricopeptide (TPR) repeat protein